MVSRRQICIRLHVVQVDTVLSRLTALKEHIEGSEALIEIDLDHRRNELVSFNLVSLAACLHLCVTVCAVTPTSLLISTAATVVRRCHGNHRTTSATSQALI